MDADIWREEQIGAEQEQERIEAELDRLWGVYEPECPYTDAGPETARTSSERDEPDA